jgi:hypothetical protein
VRSWDLQVAILAKLRASTTLAALATGGIHDAAPQDVIFPHIIIGDGIGVPADTDDSLGGDPVTEIHAWSRYRGKKEVKQIADEVYSILHRQPLVVSGAAFTDCFIESREIFLDNDGLTRHGVQRFRVLLDDIER